MSEQVGTKVSIRARTHEIISLTDLIRRLFQPALGALDATVAVVNVFLHVAHVVKFKAPFALLMVVCIFVLGFQGFAVGLWTQAEILFRIGKQVVWTGADKVRAAHLWISDVELGGARRARASHELLAHELFCEGGSVAFCGGAVWLAHT